MLQNLYMSHVYHNCQFLRNAKELECQSNQRDETSVEEGQIFEIYIAKQLQRHPENIDKRNSRARTESDCGHLYSYKS